MSPLLYRKRVRLQVVFDFPDPARPRKQNPKVQIRNLKNVSRKTEKTLLELAAQGKIFALLPAANLTLLAPIASWKGPFIEASICILRFAICAWSKPWQNENRQMAMADFQ